MSRVYLVEHACPVVFYRILKKIKNGSYTGSTESTELMFTVDSVDPV